MRPKRFSGFTFIRNAQSNTFEIQGCISTEIVEELYDKIPKINSQIHL